MRADVPHPANSTQERTHVFVTFMTSRYSQNQNTEKHSKQGKRKKKMGVLSGNTGKTEADFWKWRRTQETMQ